MKTTKINKKANSLINQSRLILEMKKHNIKRVNKNSIVLLNNYLADNL
ncbi:MAG: hypothetical protein WC533_03060 [Candidatus Pacearchaeota archaeon]